MRRIGSLVLREIDYRGAIQMIATGDAMRLGQFSRKGDYERLWWWGIDGFDEWQMRKIGHGGWVLGMAARILSMV